MKGRTLFVDCFVAFTLVITGAQAAIPESSPPPELKPPLMLGEWEADPMMPTAWHLGQIRAFEAWKVTKGKRSTVIAVVDSGINYNHPELSPNIRWNFKEWPMSGQDKDRNGFVDDVIGWDFVKSSAYPFDRSGHGTFMSGLIAGVEGNGLGASGVCPECTLLPVRSLNWEGVGSTEDCIEAIKYAANNGASIINYSVAGEGFDQEMFDVFKATLEKDIVVVVAASNDGVNLEKSEIYPAKFSLPNMITVAATDQKDKLIEMSNWGAKSVHLAAPGADMVSTWFDGYASDGAGTSDAAAVATGAVGLVRSAAPYLSAPQVVQILLATARVTSTLAGKVLTGAVLDAGEAVRCASTYGLPCLQKVR